VFRFAADAKSAENGSLITIPPKCKKVKHFLKIFIYNIENGKLCDKIMLKNYSQNLQLKVIFAA